MIGSDDLGLKSLDPICGGDLGQLTEQDRSQTASLEVVGDRERHFGAILIKPYIETRDLLHALRTRSGPPIRRCDRESLRDALPQPEPIPWRARKISSTASRLTTIETGEYALLVIWPHHPNAHGRTVAQDHVTFCLNGARRLVITGR